VHDKSYYFWLWPEIEPDAHFVPHASTPPSNWYNTPLIAAQNSPPLNFFTQHISLKITVPTSRAIRRGLISSFKAARITIIARLRPVELTSEFRGAAMTAPSPRRTPLPLASVVATSTTMPGLPAMLAVYRPSQIDLSLIFELRISATVLVNFCMLAPTLSLMRLHDIFASF